MIGGLQYGSDLVPAKVCTCSSNAGWHPATSLQTPRPLSRGNATPPRDHADSGQVGPHCTAQQTLWTFGQSK